MAAFRVTVVNSEFGATSDIEADSLEAARVHALKGALQMGAEEICKGKPFFGAEIQVASEENEHARMVVAIGATTLR